jgi:hypothetical protein
LTNFVHGDEIIRTSIRSNDAMPIRHFPLATVLTCMVATSAHAKVTAIVEQVPSPQDQILVRVTYSNNGDLPVGIQMIDLPSPRHDGKLRNELLSIQGDDGTYPRYLGNHTSFVQKARTRLHVIEPGQTLRRTVDIGGNYDLIPGMTYSVTPTAFRQSPADHSGDVKNTAEFTDIPSIRVKVPVSFRPAQEVNHSRTSENINACTWEQQFSVTMTMVTSSAMARDTWTYLDSLYTKETIGGEEREQFNQTPRYTSWFGTHGDANVENPTNARIRQVVEAAMIRHGRLNPPSCDCTKEDEELGTTAWVDPSKPYVINYCSAFFKLPLGPNVATGSRTATMYHEITHFRDPLAGSVSDLDQKFNTPEEARYIAKAARDLAADNAYNFEYFADNVSKEE